MAYPKHYFTTSWLHVIATFPMRSLRHILTGDVIIIRSGVRCCYFLGSLFSHLTISSCICYGTQHI